MAIFTYSHTQGEWRETGNISNCTYIHTYSHMQGDSRGKVNILGGVVSVVVRKEVHMNMCLILNSYRDRVV